MNKVELLSPAGDIERLKYAFEYGADAVYLGAEEYGMRAAPKNFTLEQLQEAVDIANSLGKKIYLTLNTVPTNEEVVKMPEFIRKVADIGVHAVIVADLGVLSMVKEIAPDMEVHISTQAGIVNYVSANAAYSWVQNVLFWPVNCLLKILSLSERTHLQTLILNVSYMAQCVCLSQADACCPTI